MCLPGGARPRAGFKPDPSRKDSRWIGSRLVAILDARERPRDSHTLYCGLAFARPFPYVEAEREEVPGHVRASARPGHRQARRQACRENGGQARRQARVATLVQGRGRHAGRREADGQAIRRKGPSQGRCKGEGGGGPLPQRWGFGDVERGPSRAQGFWPRRQGVVQGPPRVAHRASFPPRRGQDERCGGCIVRSVGRGGVRLPLRRGRRSRLREPLRPRGAMPTAWAGWGPSAAPPAWTSRRRSRSWSALRRSRAT